MDIKHKLKNGLPTGFEEEETGYGDVSGDGEQGFDEASREEWVDSIPLFGIRPLASEKKRTSHRHHHQLWRPEQQ